MKSRLSSRSILNYYFTISAVKLALVLFKISKRIVRYLPYSILFYPYEFFRWTTHVFYYKRLFIKEQSRIEKLLRFNSVSDCKLIIILTLSEHPKLIKKTLRSIPPEVHEVVLYNPQSFRMSDKIEGHYKIIKTIDDFTVSVRHSDYFILLEPGDILERHCVKIISSALKESTAKILRFNFCNQNKLGIRMPITENYFSQNVHLEKSSVPNNYVFASSLLQTTGSDKHTPQDIICQLINLRVESEFKKISCTLLKKSSGNYFFPEKIRLLSENAEDTEGASVSIIIPTKNKFQLVKTCLESIYKKSTYQNFEIILVDNGSDEKELLEYIEYLSSSKKGRFNVIRYTLPFNFSAINNVAASISNSKYLVFLNNDTEIITPNWMEEMIRYAKESSHGVIGVKLVYKNKLIQHAGIVMGGREWCDHIYLGHSSKSFLKRDFNYPKYYPAVTAACIMIEREKFNLIGGFDEKFSVEYNDIDLCMKATALNYSNVYLSSVKVFHYESASRGYFGNTPEKLQKHRAEKEYFSRKWKIFLNKNRVELDSVHMMLMKVTK